jgi:hypothetical protein
MIQVRKQRFFPLLKEMNSMNKTLLLFALILAPLPALAQQPDTEPCCCCAFCYCGKDCQCAAKKKCCPECHCGGSEAVKKPNYGVNTEKLSKDECYRVNGKPVSDRLLTPAVPDDSSKLHLTIIGSQAERQRVLADLAAAPELAEFRDRFQVQDYPPDHWAVCLCGFHCQGHPTIYLQLPNGKVLHRQDDYDGPSNLAKALRRAASDYDANKDPDLRNSPFDVHSIPPAAWLLIGGFGLTLLLTKKG